MNRNSIVFLSCALLLAAAGTCDAGEGWHPAEGRLMTRWAKEVSPTNALTEYPRPQLVRDRWQNLNGLWDYVITAKEEIHSPKEYQGKLLVPFPIESALSGVMKPLLAKDRLWVRRVFRVPEEWRGADQHVLLHFGAVDWECAV